MDTCTSRLQLYKITKGYGLRKVLRISTWTIKVGDIEEVVYLLASQLTSDSWKNLRGFVYHIEGLVHLQIIMLGQGCGILEGRSQWSQKVTSQFNLHTD